MHVAQGLIMELRVLTKVSIENINLPPKTAQWQIV